MEPHAPTMPASFLADNRRSTARLRTSAGLRTFASLLLVTLVLRIPALVNHPFCIDESYYSAGAAELLAGGTFFRDVVDHKPPGIYLIYAVVFALAGVYNAAAVHAVLILACACCAYGVGLLARELFDDRTGVWAGMIYATASVIGPANDFQAANTELFVNLPIVGALWLCARASRGGMATGHAVLLGLLVGIAALIRPQSALVLLPIGALWFRRRMGLRRLVWGAAAVGLPLLLTGMWLWRAGALPDAAASMAYARYYAASLPFELKLVNGILKTLFFVAIDVGLVIPVVAFLAHGRRRDLQWRCGAGCLLSCWLVATFAGIAGGGRFYPHYFVLALPPLAVLAARQLTTWRAEGAPCRAGD